MTIGNKGNEINKSTYTINKNSHKRKWLWDIKLRVINNKLITQTFFIFFFEAKAKAKAKPSCSLHYSLVKPSTRKWGPRLVNPIMRKFFWRRYPPLFLYSRKGTCTFYYLSLQVKSSLYLPRYSLLINNFLNLLYVLFCFLPSWSSDRIESYLYDSSKVFWQSTPTSHAYTLEALDLHLMLVSNPFFFFVFFFLLHIYDKRKIQNFLRIQVMLLNNNIIYF